MRKTLSADRADLRGPDVILQKFAKSADASAFNSICSPTGGPPGNFLSAGGHYQAPGHTGKPESGDLTSLEVRQDGSAYLVTTTDAFTREDLLAGDKTALMLHGAESSDLAMERVACGVIGTG